MKNIAIIGGGAAGLFAAVTLLKAGQQVTVYERNDRLGRKLSQTGNGQGNVTNANMGACYYFSDMPERVQTVLSRFTERDLIAFLEEMGGLFLPDARGRVYPAGRQASAVTDLFRREVASLGGKVKLNEFVREISFRKKFLLTASAREEYDCVLLAAGGMAQKNFGTDGNGYALARTFGHSVIAPSPALVPVKCEGTKGLRGLRVDGELTLTRGGKEIVRVRGDVLFTDFGISGDAAFYLSSFVREGDCLVLDFLPDVPKERLCSAVKGGEDGLLCIVNNAVARAVYKRAGGERNTLVSLLKSYPMPVFGTLGFDRAQVTKGGIPLTEVSDNMESKLRSGLYFAGEILNVDGVCGGYNLQWAFSSAHAAAEGILCD